MRLADGSSSVCATTIDPLAAGLVVRDVRAEGLDGIAGRHGFR